MTPDKQLAEILRLIGIESDTSALEAVTRTVAGYNRSLASERKNYEEAARLVDVQMKRAEQAEQRVADLTAELEDERRESKWSDAEHQRAYAAIQQSESLPENTFPSFQERVWWRTFRDRADRAEQRVADLERESDEAGKGWKEAIDANRQLLEQLRQAERDAIEDGNKSAVLLSDTCNKWAETQRQLKQAERERDETIVKYGLQVEEAERKWKLAIAQIEAERQRVADLWKEREQLNFEITIATAALNMAEEKVAVLMDDLHATALALVHTRRHATQRQMNKAREEICQLKAQLAELKGR